MSEATEGTLEEAPRRQLPLEGLEEYDIPPVTEVDTPSSPGVLGRVLAQPQMAMAALAFFALLLMGFGWLLLSMTGTHPQEKEPEGSVEQAWPEAVSDQPPAVVDYVPPEVDDEQAEESLLPEVAPEKDYTWQVGEPMPWIVPADAPRLALVIDDWGNYREETEALFLALPIPFAAAVIPHLPQSEKDARKVAEAGFDVMLHLPMEPEVPIFVESGMITVDMTDEEVQETVRRAFRSVPGAIAVNNHQGSKATANSRIMELVLAEARQAGKLFLDSRTSSDTVVPAVASQMGLAFLERSTFLDGETDVAYIRKQLLEAAHKAVQDGVAIAIGHVRSETVQAIAETIPEVLQMGVEFVKVSELVRWPQAAVVEKEEIGEHMLQEPGVDNRTVPHDIE